MTKSYRELFLATSACAMESDTIAGVNGGKATRLIPRDFDFVSNLVSLNAVGLGILQQLRSLKTPNEKRSQPAPLLVELRVIQAKPEHQAKRPG
jgi:hypothetical protein